MKTVFLDIDGTILSHPEGTLGELLAGEYKQEILPGVLKKLEEWRFKNYTIILVTARPESMRTFTCNQLANLGILYNLLIMGLNHSQRVLINDGKPYTYEPSALAIIVDRNKGIGDIEI